MPAIFLLAFSTASLLKNLPSSLTLNWALAGDSSPSQPTSSAGIISPQSDTRMVACLLGVEGRSLAGGFQGGLDGIEALLEPHVELPFLEPVDEFLEGLFADAAREDLLLGVGVRVQLDVSRLPGDQ